MTGYARPNYSCYQLDITSANPLALFASWPVELEYPADDALWPVGPLFAALLLLGWYFGTLSLTSSADPARQWPPEPDYGKYQTLTW